MLSAPQFLGFVFSYRQLNNLACPLFESFPYFSLLMCRVLGLFLRFAFRHVILSSSSRFDAIFRLRIIRSIISPWLILGLPHYSNPFRIHPQWILLSECALRQFAYCPWLLLC